jgi:hypothetical protein
MVNDQAIPGMRNLRGFNDRFTVEEGRPTRIPSTFKIAGIAVSEM